MATPLPPHGGPSRDQAERDLRDSYDAVRADAQARGDGTALKKAEATFARALGAEPGDVFAAIERHRAERARARRRRWQVAIIAAVLLVLAGVAAAASPLAGLGQADAEVVGEGLGFAQVGRLVAVDPSAGGGHTDAADAHDIGGREARSFDCGEEIIVEVGHKAAARRWPGEGEGLSLVSLDADNVIGVKGQVVSVRVKPVGDQIALPDRICHPLHISDGLARNVGGLGTAPIGGECVVVHGIADGVILAVYGQVGHGCVLSGLSPSSASILAHMIRMSTPLSKKFQKNFSPPADALAVVETELAEAETELVRARGFVRGAETQVLKAEQQVAELRAAVEALREAMQPAPIPTDPTTIHVAPGDDIQAAIAQLRDGYPDRLLFERGGTYRGGLGHWRLSGRSSEAPMIVGSYGDPDLPRPLFLTDGDGLVESVGAAPVEHVVFRDLHAYANQRDPDHADYTGEPTGEVGVTWRRAGRDIRFENLLLEYYANGMNLGQRTEYDVHDITLNGCTIRNSWQSWQVGHSQGVFADRITGLTITDCVFDHNGWSAEIPRAKRTGFNHNVYIYQCSAVAITDSTFANGSNMGVKVAADEPDRTRDITITGNLFTGNLTGIKISGDDGDTESLVIQGVNVAGNVITRNGGDLDGTTLGEGVVLSQVNDAAITDNLFIDKTAETNWYAINIDTWRPNGSIAVTGNVVDRWPAEEPLINGKGADLPGVSVTGNRVNTGAASRSLDDYQGEADTASVVAWLVEPTLEPMIYTWFEANSQQWLDGYIAHAADWPGLPIMTARGHNVISHTQQCLDAGLLVISGFKTSDFLGGREYEDPEAWAQIAALAREVSTMTGGRPVVIDNEGAVKAWRDAGGEAVNYDALLAAIEAQDWPEMWWWYGPLGAGEPLQSISRDIARAVVNGMPGARLIEANTAGYKRSPAWLGNAENAAALAVNIDATNELDPNSLAIIYLDDEAANFWPLAETQDAIEQAPGDVILYPGVGDLDRSGDID